MIKQTNGIPSGAQTPTGTKAQNINKTRPLLQGQKRIDKYIVSMKKLLGKGSYAYVYRGVSTQDNQPCAVKVIDQKLFANTYNFKTIQSEIQIMKKVQHQNIVALKDVYQSTNNVYILTELCEDGDLREYLKMKGKLNEPEALRLLRDIMAGFRYLYDRQISHRDLKPANILLHKGRCKISDFGFAKNLQYGQNTIMRSIVGTPLYMSPQILRHQKYTNKSDLWSVGLIYYELMHGRTPWPAQNEMQLLNNIMVKNVSFDSSVSENSRDFIKMCLKVNEQDRMSWEDAFNHSLLKEEQADRILRNLRFEDARNKQNSPFRFSRSKSAHRIGGHYNLSRTPKMKKNLTTLQFTPEKTHKWRG